jgi:hypothetical protein
MSCNFIPPFNRSLFLGLAQLVGLTSTYAIRGHYFSISAGIMHGHLGNVIIEGHHWIADLELSLGARHMSSLIPLQMRRQVAVDPLSFFCSFVLGYEEE